MESIAEYAARRQTETNNNETGIPEVRPFARKHVEALQAAGQAARVLRQLRREAQSSRAIDTEAALAQYSTAFNLEELERGLEAFLEALRTAKVTKHKVQKVEHVGASKNPINTLSVEEQGFACWDTIVSMAGVMARPDRPTSCQVVAGRIGKRLRTLLAGAEPYGELGYERAGLVLMRHFCRATGWVEQRSGGTRMGSAKRKPNVFAFTPRFLDDVLGGGMAADFSERRPMLVRPVPWVPTATHGGYLHAPVRAVRGAHHAIGSESIVGALNAVQDTPFRINRRILDIAATFTTNAEEPDGKLVRGHYIEDRMDLADAVVRSRTIRSALTLSAARDLAEEPEFWFPWNLDHRGRMYPATSSITPQGSDLCKGLLEFADGTPIGDDGGAWLAVHLCNLAGADKAVVPGDRPAPQTRTKAERVRWVLDHEDEILAVAADPLRNRAWHLPGGFGLEKVKAGRVVSSKIDKPWQFLAACFEWAEYREQGAGFKSRLAGALDGSCSGVQMLSGMTRDASAGAMVNLTPTERGDDYYGRMAGALGQRLAALFDTADARTMAHLEFWNGQTMDRDLLKAPSMTKVYSAGTFTFAEQVQTKTGAPEHECMWLANQINACFTDVAPGMLAAMDYLQRVSDVLTEAGQPLRWRTPAGLAVEQARVQVRSVELQLRDGDVLDKYAFEVDTDQVCPRKQRAGVSPNFVHGVDAAHMVRTINALHARGVRNFWMIHDSFGAPFAQCDDVYAATREEFVGLMGDDLLSRWTADVTAGLDDETKSKLPPLPAYGTLDLGAVRDSQYAWF